MSDAPPPSEDLHVPDDDAARWQAAKQVRFEHPQWVVIWIARTAQFQAYPNFAAPRGTAPTARTAEDLAAQMEQIEQAARKPRRRPAQASER